MEPFTTGIPSAAGNWIGVSIPKPSLRSKVIQMLEAVGGEIAVLPEYRLEHSFRGSGIRVLMLLLNEFHLRIQQQLKESQEPVAVVYLCDEADLELVVKATQLGAITVLPLSSIDTNRAIVADTLRHGLQIYNRRLQWLNQHSDAVARIRQLSARQFDILELIIAGATNKQIARQKQVSEKTIEKHRSVIYERTKANSPVKLCELYMNARLLPDAAFSACGCPVLVNPRSCLLGHKASQEQPFFPEDR